ncbi:MAG: ribosome hibernation-promoting factor, HPF/YfiA family [Paracoccaceae bacterium]
MHITVTGKHIDTGEALQGHVETRMTEAIGKYFDRAVDAAVVFSRDGAFFKADATVHLPTGLLAKAQGSHNEIYGAFDEACDRIEKQLRRHKRRLKDHHQSRQNPVEAFAAPSYVLAAQADEPEIDAEAADPAAHGENGSQPVIIAEMTTDIKRLSVGEAVMQMELAHVPFLVFKNDASGRLNIVFQRDDGNIGWIDPALTGEA